MKQLMKQAMWLLLALTLTVGCGDIEIIDQGNDDDDDDNAVATGLFIDAAVQGVTYETETQSGVTGADGSFLYIEGENVTFSIGDIVLPTATAQGLITPFEIANTTDIENQVVVNVSRLLQTLDSDGNPDNGISIDESVAAGVSMDVTSSIEAFETSFADKFKDLTIVSQEQATSHLISSLSKLADDPNLAGLLGTLQSIVDVFTDPDSLDLPESLIGKALHLKFSTQKTDFAFSNDEEVKAIITGPTLTLTPTDTSNVANTKQLLATDKEGSEHVWKDPVTGYVYKLSIVSEKLNEINVFDKDKNFIGSFTLVASDSDGEVQNLNLVKNLAGTYNVTETTTGTHTRNTVVIGADGSIDFDTDMNFAVSEISTVYDRLSALNQVYVEYGAILGLTNARIDLTVDTDGNLTGIKLHEDVNVTTKTEVTVTKAEN